MNYNYFELLNYPFYSNSSIDNELYGPYEGYLKGNLFKNLYSEYKDYKPNAISINSEKEELLFNINQICFAMHEINLLLDVYPDNKEMLNLYTNYQNTYNDLLKKYQENYGPIDTNSIKNEIPFSWENISFPWEVN